MTTSFLEMYIDVNQLQWDATPLDIFFHETFTDYLKTTHNCPYTYMHIALYNAHYLNINLLTTFPQYIEEI
jgi:hypothetical protein